MKFNKANCKILCLDQGNPKQKTNKQTNKQTKKPVLEENKLSFEEKDLTILINEKLSMSCQYALAAQKANHSLGWIRRSMGEVIFCTTPFS